MTRRGRGTGGLAQGTGGRELGTWRGRGSGGAWRWGESSTNPPLLPALAELPGRRGALGLQHLLRDPAWVAGQVRAPPGLEGRSREPYSELTLETLWSPQGSYLLTVSWGQLGQGGSACPCPGPTCRLVVAAVCGPQHRLCKVRFSSFWGLIRSRCTITQGALSSLGELRPAAGVGGRSSSSSRPGCPGRPCTGSFPLPRSAGGFKAPPPRLPPILFPPRHPGGPFGATHTVPAEAWDP